MELSDQLARVTLDARRDPAAVILDEIHHDEAGVGVMDMRDRELRMPRQLGEHVSLKLET